MGFTVVWVAELKTQNSKQKKAPKGAFFIGWCRRRDFPLRSYELRGTGSLLTFGQVLVSLCRGTVLVLSFSQNSKPRTQNANKKAPKGAFFIGWCRRRDSNSHGRLPTTPSRWRVYQFHHFGKMRAYYFQSPLKCQALRMNISRFMVHRSSLPSTPEFSPARF